MRPLGQMRSGMARTSKCCVVALIAVCCAAQGENATATVPPQFDHVGTFSEGLAVVRLKKKFGYIDTSGRLVIPLQFAGAAPFSEGLALVYTTLGMNLLGKTEGVWLFASAGYIDHSGKFVIKPRLVENARKFSEGLAAFEPGASSWGTGKWGYLNRAGKWGIKPSFEIATDFSEGLAAVEVSVGKEPGHKEPTYKWGYIDHTGKFAIPPQFYGAMPFSNGVATVTDWNKNGHLHPRTCIDKQGNWVQCLRSRKPTNIPDSTSVR